MSAVARLAGYAAALALVFGVALAAGAVVGPSRDGSTRADAGHRAAGPAAMTDMEAHRSGGRVAVQPVRGLAVGDDAVGLELAHTTARPGEPFRLGFRIVGRDGRTVRGFDVEHTKRMHLIVVRRDMAGFEHLHPTQAADGAWSAPVTLHDAGSYRVFADFSVGGTPRTLAADLQADGRVASQPFPASADLAAVDGLRVRLTEGASHAGEASQLGFTVTRDGRPVAVQDFLGAKGHLVALRQGDLAFLHVHPDESSLKFMATFPTAGSYRLFLQFKTEGRVHTAAFTQEVSR